MASRRNLKKLINQEVCLFIDDCYEFTLQKKASDEVVEPLIDEAVHLFDRLIAMMNKKEEQRNSYYRSIEMDLINGIKELNKRLAEV